MELGRPGSLGLILSIEPEVTSALLVSGQAESENDVKMTDADVHLPLSVVGKMVDYAGESLTDEVVPACTEVVSLFKDMEVTRVTDEDGLPVRRIVDEELKTGYLMEPIAKGNMVVFSGESNSGKLEVALSAATEHVKEGDNCYAVVVSY